MQYQVKLKHFQDDDTGTWGFTHLETYKEDYSFNAFYNAEGIMHDIFEHWFEGQLKYFKGDNICNVYGEMVASGVRVWMYTWGMFDVFDYRTNQFAGRDRTFYEDTESYIVEKLEDPDRSSFYPIHNINLPYQKDTKDYNLEGIISDYWDVLIGDHSVNTLHECGVYRSYIQNAYRYGYRLAERMFGKYAYAGQYERQALCSWFYKQLKFWHEYTERYNAEHLAIHDEYAYSLNYLQCTLHNHSSKLPIIKYQAVDAVGNVHPLDSLISY
jgi:hypothetical protein